MSTTRRQFIQSSVSKGALLGGALATCGTSALSQESQDAEDRPVPKRILILGGTGFLGPALIDAVLERGHSLTLFNSGTTDKRRQDAGRDSVVPEGVELLLGNRDPEQTADDRRLRGLSEEERAKQADPNSPKGLSSLAGKTWDAVIDTSGYWPRIVKASAEALASSVEQYAFISTISVYADNSTPGTDETAEVLSLTDPASEDFGSSFENYGGGKAMCEAVAEAAMPGRATNIRPGFIVGPRDSSRRYCYWPWRVAKGGEMLAPGNADDPVQIIDVRDLAEWTVHCIEKGTMGVFNATGPKPAMTFGDMLAGCKEGVGGDATVTFADAGFLAERGLNYPIWVANESETKGFHTVSVDKAVAAGLTFRTQAETAKATLDWMETLDEATQAKLVPGQLYENEAEALAAWKASQDADGAGSDE